MKLEEIKMNIDVKVVEVKGEFTAKEYIGREGKVVDIDPNVLYPVKVDFGYITILFKPEELEEV